MTITPYTKQQLEGASREAVADAMRRLPVDDVPPQWLLQGQKYSEPDISKALKEDYANGSIDDSALAQRIAASVPSHVVDGWSYFGRAVHCLIRGDTRNSVHLGYYAELRATLAIMAAEGVGVFNKQHFIIDSTGKSQRLHRNKNALTKAGTHSIIWPIYRWWSQQYGSHDLVTSVIQPDGRAMRDWFTSTSRRDIYVLPSAENWLADWGLDLKRMSRDQGARNASSYGPSAIHNWKVISGEKSVDTVVRLWELFNPTISSRFNQVDRLFLRKVLWSVFDSQTTRRMGSRPWLREFSDFVDNFLEEQDNPLIVGPRLLQWKQFLCDNGEIEDFPIGTAGQQSGIDEASFPVEVLSRAALLLRIATGSCGLHLIDIGIEWDSLEFWINDIGVRRGFWKQGTFPEDPTDLWTDILEALENLEEVQQSGSWQDESPHSATTPSFVSSLARLEECERIGLWGFGV